MRIVRFGEEGWFVSLEAPRAHASRAAREAGRALRHALPDADIVTGGDAVAVFGAVPRAVVEAAMRTQRTRALGPPAPPLLGRGAISDVCLRHDARGPTGRSALHERRAVSNERLLAEPREDTGETIHELRACYDGGDREAVAETLGVTVGELVDRHASVDWEVEMLGFLPGFAYLSGESGVACVPRRPAPRPRVPAGAIAVAAGFSGVYPVSSPGGWSLLGRTDGRLLDPSMGPLLRVGDHVRFVPVDALEPAPLDELAYDRGALRVLRAPALATVQDGGRLGRLSEGIPPSGPLDPATHARANAAVGNALGEACVEVPWGTLEVEAERPIILSVDGAAPLELASGERLVATGLGVAYVAVRGGIDTPVVLGARSVHVAARLGGRPLRRGDRLPIGDRHGAQTWAPGDEDEGALAVIPGPHLDLLPTGTFDQLSTSTYRVSRRSDRTGTRLLGGGLRGVSLELLPAPLVRGAVQLTPDGTLVVMGPDHPTTGGYPIVAVLTRAAQSHLARLAPDALVRFAP